MCHFKNQTSGLHGPIPKIFSQTQYQGLHGNTPFCGLHGKELYIVRSLPISTHHPFWLSIIDKTSTQRSVQIKDWLMDNCIRRYSDLSYEHQQNFENTIFEARDIQKYYISKSDKNLFVLDLDECIVYAS